MAVLRVGTAVSTAPWLRLLWAMARMNRTLLLCFIETLQPAAALVNEFRGASAICGHGMCKNVSHDSCFISEVGGGTI